ncbi:MAG TPA: flagellar hook-length control protein FliK [Gammaproteobacteria bacterium]|nr:flagellar hook-length control protein FliK [Gammaproteobacteria bacterium]
MELSAQLPPELLALAAPAERAPPEVLRAPDGSTDGAAAAVPFDALLLELAGTATPSGDALPANGNGLPSAPDDLPPKDVPAATPLDALAVSGLLALVAPPPLPPVAPPPPEAGSATPAPSVSVAAPPTPGELATLQQLRAALDRAAVPTTAPPDAGDVASAASYPPADVASSETVEAGQAPAAARTSADVAPPQPAPVASPADRVVAAMVAAQSAPAAEAAAPAAASAAAPVARAAGEPRPGTERRTAGTSTKTPASADAQRASAAPLPQPFDLASAASAGDRPAAASQPAHAAEPLPIVVTPTTGSAAPADAQPTALPHSPSVSMPAAATSLDGSSANSMSPTAHQGGSLDTTAARWHDALASRVQWLVDHDLGEARIKLNPPELGALDVKISLHDDKTFVQLTAHNAAARDELTQSLPRLRELLSANGLELGGATVSGGRDDRAGRYPGPEAAARSFDVADATEPTQAVRASRGTSSRIDVFA